MTLKSTGSGTPQSGGFQVTAPFTFSVIRERYLVPLGLFLLCGWFVFSAVSTVQQVLAYYNALPFWDYWRIAQHLSHYQSLDLRVFWRQHNDHRIVFPEVVFALDMLVLHGRMILPLAVSLLSYLATWLLLSSTLFADRTISRPIAAAAALLAGVIAFWYGSAVLLAAPFQLQWTLMQLSASSALLCLSKVKNSSRSIYLAGTIAAAVVANYSSGNGLLLWPLLLVLAVALRLDRRRLLTLTIASLVSVTLYFVGYQFGSDLNLRNLVLHPVYLLGYICSYISMPFGGINPPELGILVGLGSLSFTILWFVIALRRHWLTSCPGFVLFGSYAFTLLTILITAAGRMDPNDPSFGGAKPPRYITVPLMNWAVFILLSFWISAKARFRFLSPPLLTCIFSFLLLLNLPKLRDWTALITKDYSEQQLSSLAMENDIFDPNLLRKIFISPDFIMQYVPELRQQHLSIYYKGRDRWLGKPLTQFSPVSKAVISGEITNTFPVKGGVEIMGWADSSQLRLADNTQLRRTYTWVALANESGRIVGFGRRIAAGFPSNLLSDTLPGSLGWVGFANSSVPAQSISAYAVDSRRGGLFKIPGSISMPALQHGSLEESTGMLPEVTWQKDAIWTENTLPPRVLVGETPPGVTYGSWSGNDANRGQIVSSTFETPANGCLILPVIHGPRVHGLSAEIIDVDTAKPIASAPMQDDDTTWEYWRIPLSPAVHHLREVARDDGPGWGEWLAIATPLTCR